MNPDGSPGAQGLSIVIPAHQEADNLPGLLAELRGVLESLGHEWEIIVVDDGSTDGTWGLLRQAACDDPRVRGIRLTRNFGHQMALTAGLARASGKKVITMDGDLQHPPEKIPDLLAKADEGYDVVYAIRSTRDSEGWFKVRSAALFYWVLNRLTSLNLPRGGADFRFMSRDVVNSLQAMPERHRFLRGMTRWVGYDQAVIEYDRAPRRAGRSKYSLRQMARFAHDAIVGFSALPLRLASFGGILFAFLGMMYFVYVLIVRLVVGVALPGWTSVLGTTLVLGGAQLACIGIMGQYLGRMYDEVKARPLFLVWDDTRPEVDDSRAQASSGQLVRGSNQI